MRIFKAVAIFLLSSLIFGVSSLPKFKQDSDNGLDVICTSNTDCDSNEFCNKEYCSSAEGICSPRPEFCATQIDPICGCDGKSYQNACKAMQEGVDFGAKGECKSEPVSGTCTKNSDCEEENFCFFQDCEAESGTCAPRGEVCPAVYEPVCGCDGKTYPNRCSAFVVGASVNNKGACDNKKSMDDDKESMDDDKEEEEEDDRKTTSAPDADDDDEEGDTPCESTQDCGPNQFCNKATCETPSGVCTERVNAICTADWKPVCGCDGKTYPNQCVALSEGILLKDDGECPESSKNDDDDEIDMPCTKNDDCADGYFCNRDSCGSESGICASKDVKCETKEDKPVCACNGQTFANSCEARKAGAILATPGACPTQLSMTEDSCKTTEDCDAGEYCKLTQCGASEDGVCTAKPAFCAEVYSPVCDCNGKTHPNLCHAASAGVNVKHVGECEIEEKDAVCLSNVDCDDDEYCRKEACSVSQGMCVERGIGSLCAMEYKPVCGCDGKTHTNPCKAAQAGVNVNFNGECSKPPSMETSAQQATPAPTAAAADDDDDEVEEKSDNKETKMVCADDAECPADDDFCYKETCNAPQGLCTKNVEIVCADFIQPVCGCDGKTYSAGCKALLAGVNVDQQGACEHDDIECDGNEDCKQAEYCSKSSCSSPTGKCSTKPEYCPALFVADPVCGCDGISHSSACHAQSLGVNVNYKGACNYTRQPIVSKCFENDDCPEGHRCVKASCGGMGECRVKSSNRICFTLYKPVCGCDGQTYSNACSAEVAGVNVNFNGECKKNRKLKRRK